MKKRVLSGIQPSGSIHLGNYLGAIQNWVVSQDEYENIFCVVDLHAITIPQDPKVLKKNIRELAGILFACGIDPKKSSLFVQSDVSEHAELAWILNCSTPMGWLNRMTQFKEKTQKQKPDKITLGLYSYPVLMASDILLYDSDLVPVGEDQKQHVELTRDLAQKFNSAFGEIFKIPNPVIPKISARVMALDDPSKKMSKSDEKKSHAVFVLDSPDEILNKFKRATTDSLKEIRFDQNRLGIFNLLSIYAAITKEKNADIEAKFEGKGYGDFKKAVAEVVIEALRPVRERYDALMKDPSHVEALLKEGASRVQPIAAGVLARTRKALGIGS